MWKKLGNPVPIDKSQVVLGLYVWLDLTWDKHPFFASRLMVATPKDLAIIQSLDLDGKLYYYPERSTVQPGAVQLAEPSSAEPDAQALAQAQERAAAQSAIVQEVRALEQAKKEKQMALREAAARADQAWGNAARATKQALNDLPRSPKTAGRQLQLLSNETAALVSKGQEVLLHLLGDQKEQGPQFHALNCMTLSMLIGKKAGMPERALADLALAALAHDAGEAQVPQHIIRSAQRKKHEEDFYRQHVEYGVRCATDSGAFTPEAIAMIADHHENMDGSGWPKGKKGADLSMGARVLALVDRYDTLCSPESGKSIPLMPAEALATLYRNEQTRIDGALLGLMIKLLGVYPPGTVVQLSDGTLALVIAPGANSLKPTVLIYSPEMSKDEAPTLELANEPELKIAEAIRPSTLPQDVFQWLSPQQRLSYFFSVEDRR